MNRLTYLFVLALLVLPSCEQLPPPDIHGIGIGKVAAYVDVAKQNNPQPKVVEQCLDGIEQELPTLVAEREATAQIIKKQSETISGKDVEIGVLSSVIEAYKDRWVGDLTFKWARLLIGIYVGLAILGSVLTQFTGGWLNVVGKNIVWLLPMINPFRWLTALISMFVKKK